MDHRVRPGGDEKEGSRPGGDEREASPGGDEGGRVKCGRKERAPRRENGFPFRSVIAGLDPAIHATARPRLGPGVHRRGASEWTTGASPVVTKRKGQALGRRKGGKPRW